MQTMYTNNNLRTSRRDVCLQNMSIVDQFRTSLIEFKKKTSINFISQL